MQRASLQTSNLLATHFTSGFDDRFGISCIWQELIDLMDFAFYGLQMAPGRKSSSW